jgi:hypothetical protein
LTERDPFDPQYAHYISRSASSCAVTALSFLASANSIV